MLLRNPAGGRGRGRSNPPIELAFVPLRTSPRLTPQQSRRRTSRGRRILRDDAITPPYPWATDRRATIHSLEHLQSKEISAITGDVLCQQCDRQYPIEFDLHSKFREIARFIVENVDRLHDRAPREWLNPVLPTCLYCHKENSLKPIVGAKKKQINWLFLLLGQMLGCCTLEQLKYFLKHTKTHRTGAKERVLYDCYLVLCKQLDPAEFNRFQSH